MLDAIDILQKEGKLGIADAALARDLFSQNDYNMRSIWQVYSVQRDFTDLGDSLTILLEVVRDKRQPKP